jgi:hypothetical protein
MGTISKNEGMVKMPGELTAQIAETIKADWEKRGYDVYYDHKKKQEHKNVGKIVSALKMAYGRDDELSQLDITVVEQGSAKAVLLVGIEENSDRPKTLLGDIFGVLFGKLVSFNKEPLKVGDYTTLVVAGISKSKEKHEDRKKKIEELANRAKGSLGTGMQRSGRWLSKFMKMKLKLRRNYRSI